MEKQKLDLYRPMMPLVQAAIDFRHHRIITGSENIPDQPVFLIANHQLAIESLQLALSYTKLTKRALRMAVKKGYMSGTGLDDHGKFGRGAKFLMEHTHQVPVDRTAMTPDDYRRLKTTIADLMEQGDSFGVHPEGTRSSNGYINKFHSSFIRLGMELGATFLPVGIRHELHSHAPIDSHLNFGNIIPSEEYSKSHLPMGVRVKHLTNELEESIANLADLPRSHKFAEIKALGRVAVEHPDSGRRG